MGTKPACVCLLNDAYFEDIVFKPSENKMKQNSQASTIVILGFSTDLVYLYLLFSARSDAPHFLFKIISQPIWRFVVIRFLSAAEST